VFRPNTLHGWSSRTIIPCEIAVFHFDYAPDILAEYIGERDAFQVSLSDMDIDFIRSAATETKTLVNKLTYASLLRFDILLHRLALLIVERSEIPTKRLDVKLDAERVERALAFFREHMRDGIGVGDIARITSCSNAHIRRLFHSILGISVKTALLREQMHVAADRLKDPHTTVSGIADLCGYSCTSSFSRAFKGMTGSSPSKWRALHPRQNMGLNATSQSE